MFDMVVGGRNTGTGFGILSMSLFPIVECAWQGYRNISLFRIILVRVWWENLSSSSPFLAPKD